jgi:hypothetical protein
MAVAWGLDHDLTSQEMPNQVFAFALFLSSYSPAMLILAVRSIDHSWPLFWISLGVSVVSAAAFFLFLQVARRGGPFRARIDDVEPRDAELAAYVATYLLPFVVVFGATLQDVVALGLFLLFIGLLWINSGMVYLNPLLTLAGYHVYIVEMSAVGGGTVPRSFLVTHQARLRKGDRVEPDEIATGVYIDLTSRG